MLISKVFKDIFTESNGESYCPVRVLGFPSAVAMVSTYVVSALHAATVDWQGFGVGAAALLGGISSLGASIGYKAKTEERTEEPPK